jgi:hypothetical protein
MQHGVDTDDRLRHDIRVGELGHTQFAPGYPVGRVTIHDQYVVPGTDQ